MNKLLFILILGAVSANAQIKLPKQNQAINFTWLSDTVNHKPELYSALLIPVKLDGCPKLFYMQFDLGAPHSMLYSQEVKAIKTKYPETDTTTFIIAKGRPDSYRDRDKKLVIIGTIGEDLIDGKTLVIDYPGKRLTITAAIPENLSKKVVFSSFMLMKGSILFPAILNKKQTILFFDTGSSAFELLTSKTTCDQLQSPNTPTESYPVKSWGRTLTANTVPTTDSLTIAVQKLPIKRATYIEGASDSQVQQMLKLGIGGMIGNKLFLNSILILDTQNKKFALIHN